jgi:hypothetical protein
MVLCSFETLLYSQIREYPMVTVQFQIFVTQPETRLYYFVSVQFQDLVVSPETWLYHGQHVSLMLCCSDRDKIIFGYCAVSRPCCIARDKIMPWSTCKFDALLFGQRQDYIWLLCSVQFQDLVVSPETWLYNGFMCKFKALLFGQRQDYAPQLQR